MAVVTADRIVYLYDDNGEKRDKFSTKPADPNGNKVLYRIPLRSNLRRSRP